MKIIIGLGNPGKEYEKTRHSVGFMVVDAICAGSDPAIGAWKHDKKSNTEIAKGEINGKKIILAKPQTFMNNSGEAVKKLIENCKLKIENLVVIHDDLDLPLGTLRLSRGSGSAGHNGVQSIINHLKTKDFWRLRIGIGPRPSLRDGTPSLSDGIAKFVLKPFSSLEQAKLKKILKLTSSAIEIILGQGPERAQSLLTQKPI